MNIQTEDKVKSIVGNSESHVVTEPMSDLDYYRRLQMAEGKLHEIALLLERESVSDEEVAEVWRRNDYSQGNEPRYVDVCALKRIIAKRNG